MIFYYTLDITSGNFTGKKAIFLGMADESTETYIGTPQLLSNSSDFQAAAQQIGVKLFVAAIPNYKVPVLTLTPAASFVNCTDVWVGIYKRLQDSGSDMLDSKTLQVYYKSLIKFFNNDHLAKAFLTACTDQFRWLSKKQFATSIHVNFSDYDPDFINETQEVLAAISDGIDSALTPQELAANTTSFQQACTDRFYIGIPTRERLLDAIENESSSNGVQFLIPTRDAVCIPYTNEIDETPLYKQELSGSNGFSGTQPARLRAIEGDKSNNGLEIQDNEKEYYNVLKKWVKFNIKEYYHTDVDTLDPISKQYLDVLLCRLYMWHWKHNPNVPVAYKHIVDSANDSESTISNGVDSDYEFVNYPGIDTIRINAVVVLQQFMERVASEIGWEAYIQAIIQLGRWDFRKPTCIQFTDYKNVFDLGTNTVREKMASITDYKKQDINGCMCELVGYVTDDVQIADSSIGFSSWSMPVGIKVHERYVNPDGEVQDLDMYYSMIDAIREVVLGNLTISGMSYDGTNWSVSDVTDHCTVSEVLQMLEASSDHLLQFPIFRSKGLVELYMNLNTNYNANHETQFSLMNIKLRLNNILNLIDTNTFSTYSQLSEILGITVNRKLLIDYMVVRDLLKVYHEIATRYNPSWSLSRVVSEWHDSILQTGYVNESYFYADRTNNDQPLPGTKIENFPKCFWHKENPATMSQSMDNQGVKSITSFGGAAETSGTAGATGKPVQTNSVQTGQVGQSKTNQMDTESIGQSLIMKPKEGCQYCKVLDGNTLVCVCAIDEFEFTNRNNVKAIYKRFIVLSSKTSSQMNLDAITTVIQSKKLYAYLCHALSCIVQSSLGSNQLFFDSRDSIKELRNKINSLTTS